MIRLRTIETLTYNSTLYTWHHEPQNLYESRHIAIYDAVVLTEGGIVELQQVNGEERYKHIGLSPAEIIVVSTDHSETRIIIAWHASSSEVKAWLAAN